MPKYRHGKQTKPIDFETFKEKMETVHFKKSDHKSFLAFLFWFGFKRKEALEKVREDFAVKDEKLIVKATAKKQESEPSRDVETYFPYVDLIMDQVENTAKGQRVWKFSESTAWRIPKRALGKKYYPEYLRLGRENRKSDYLRYWQTKKLEQAKRIANAVRASNILFEGKKGANLFREDILRLMPELQTPCQNEAQFIMKIVCLYNLFDVRLAPLRRLVHEPEDRGAISLVEKWLQDEGLHYDADMIETWKNIVVLRNAEPVHADTEAEDLLQALTFFGMRYPPARTSDYSKLWEAILKKFAMSLEAWQNLLQNLR